MAEPIVVAPGQGEVVGDSPTRRVEILSDDDSLHATWSRFAAGQDGADLHVHRRHTDFFFVLEGELTLRLGPEGTYHALTAGTLAYVPPGIVHGFRNASDAPSRHLNFHAPGRRFADYMRAMRDGRTFSYDQFEPPAGGGLDPAGAVVGSDEVIVDVPGLRAALLADVADITIADVTVTTAPDRPAPAPHVYEHVRSLYVLDGELALNTAEGDLLVTEGSWVQVPAGTSHQVAMEGSGRARFLDIHSPGCGAAALPVMAAKTWWTAGPP